MIYLILSAGFKDNNPEQFEKRLKIGYTNNLEDRLGSYLTTNPDVILLQTLEGGMSTESYLHKKFEKYRYKDSREWFYYNQEIVNFFNNNKNFINEDILLDCIKSELRSNITPITELKEKYLNQILDEVKSRNDFKEELYDEDAISRVIVNAWEFGIDDLNKIIDNVELVNFHPIDLSKTSDLDITVDITLDLPQILGRQRLKENPWKNRAELYFKSLSESRSMTVEDFKNRINEKKSKTEELLSAYSTAIGNSVKHTLAETYQKLAKTFNYKDNYIAVNTHTGKDLLPVINNLVMISEIRAFQIQQIDYKDRFTVFRTIDQGICNDEVVIKFLNKFDNLIYFTDKMKLLCKCELDQVQIENILEQIPINYKNYYITVGPERIRNLQYKNSVIQEEYERLKNNQKIGYDLDKAIYESFFIGNKYLKTEIKIKLKEIYEKLNILGNPKASDLEKYFELREVNIIDTSTGKRVKGYEIIKIKE